MVTGTALPSRLKELCVRVHFMRNIYFKPSFDTTTLATSTANRGRFTFSYLPATSASTVFSI